LARLEPGGSAKIILISSQLDYKFFLLLFFSFNFFETPAIVPPVPADMTKASS
jgi:hypothetical protein